MFFCSQSGIDCDRTAGSGGALTAAEMRPRSRNPFAAQARLSGKVGSYGPQILAGASAELHLNLKNDFRVPIPRPQLFRLGELLNQGPSQLPKDEYTWTGVWLAKFRTCPGLGGPARAVGCRGHGQGQKPLLPPASWERRSKVIVR